jgi:hypothetical protein
MNSYRKLGLNIHVFIKKNKEFSYLAKEFEPGRYPAICHPLNCG